METPTRREWLRVAGGAGVVGLAGCGSVADRLPEGIDGSSEGIDDPIDLDARPEAADGLTTQFRQGLRNHGYFDETVPADVTVEWAVPTNRGEHTASKASPMLAPSGAILLADDTGRMRSLSTSGDTNWSTTVTDAGRGSHGTPAIADGTAYIGTYDGVVSAVSVETGEIEWQTSVADAVGASPTYHEGTLYVAAEFVGPADGRVVAMDAETGDIEWNDDWPTSHPHSTVAIDTERDRFLFGSNDGYCYAWSLSDRERAWSYDTGGDSKAPIAVSRGVAVVPSWANTVTAVDVEDGSRIWEFGPGDDVMCAPAVEDGTVYVGSHNGYCYALDLASGEELWATSTDGIINGSAVATADRVLVGSYDRRLYALDRADGSVAWVIEGDGQVTSSPLVTDDAIYYTERAPEEGDGAGMCYKLVAA